MNTSKHSIPPHNPAAHGLFMPAEWDPHHAVWLAWPHDPLTFPDRVPQVEDTYIEIIEAVHQGEIVNLLVLDQDVRERVQRKLKKRQVDTARVQIHIRDYADVWFRDYGPIFVTNAGRTTLAITHWIYNAWGNKYQALLKDAAIPAYINEQMQLSLYEPGIVLEGGSIDVNGHGALLTTEQCLLHPNRNPHLSRREIEQHLAAYLGARHIIWLNQGIAGDDTDGHIDDIARFINPHTVICAVEQDPADENNQLLQENLRILKFATDQDNKPLRIIELPMPGHVGGEQGRLPASYANFYIGNNVVLVPIFNTPNDTRALDIIQAQFKTRRAIGINCTHLVHGLGTLHCITQQQPAITQ